MLYILKKQFNKKTIKLSYYGQRAIALLIYIIIFVFIQPIHAQIDPALLTSSQDPNSSQTTQSNTIKEDTPQNNEQQTQTRQQNTNNPNDWSQTTIEDPQFDIAIQSSDNNIKQLLENYLELYRYRMLSDLTRLELRRLLERTEDNIRELTGTEGYFSPEIDIKIIPADERTENTTLPLISIHVEPGPITRITEMELLFEGDIEENQNDLLIASQRRRLRWGWAMRTGDPFTQAGWSTAKSNMLSRLTSQYYAAGRISASQATIDPQTDSAKLSITLDSGPRFFLGEYNIWGLDRYSERLVRNFARLHTGDDYLLDELNAAQRRLAESGYFENVYVYVRPDDPDPANAKINIVVREAYFQQMTIGPGFSTDNGPRLTFEYRHNQVPLLGWQLVSSLQVDRDNQRAQGTLLSIPDDDFWRWGVSLRIESENRNNEKTQSMQASYGRSFISDSLDRAYFLQYDKARTENLFTNGIQDVQAISANTSWTWRNFNNLTNPRGGWGLMLELGAGNTFGNHSAPFIRVRSRTQVFLPFEAWRSGRIVLRGEVGAVFAKTGEPMPSTLLFRTGGDTTVRGYAHRYIGVNDLNNITSSGSYMAWGSIEYQRPILINDRRSDFDWAVFVDTGSVSNDLKDINLYTGIGPGIRWRSPVGPLSMDLAYGLKTEQLRLHFNIGFTF